MPYKAKKPCAHRGCTALTSNRYCYVHAKEHMKNYNKFQRDPKANKRYGSRWREIRAVHLAENPLCVKCKEADRLTPADTVHHIKPLSEGGTHHWKNLMSLCHSCHSRLHTKQGDCF